MSTRVHLPAFERTDICGPCGGDCCKRMPGAALPSDFGFTPEEVADGVRAAISTGRWSIDWWEGDPTGGDLDRAYFIRPRIAGAPVVDPAWGGRCSWLTPTGCGSPDERPAGCRGLIPNEDECSETRHGAGKQDAAIAWIPYQELLEQFT